jgi:hypothetical protein
MSAGFAAFGATWAAFADMVVFKLSDPSSRAAPPGETDATSETDAKRLMQKADRGNSSALPEAAGRPGGRPPPNELGDLDMRIARDGTWFYRGSPINRMSLVTLFASVLRREGDGSYWLVTPAERGRVTVEDAPFVAVAVEREGTGCDQLLIFRTNLDEIVTAGPDHKLRVATAADGTPSPYILVRPGLEASPGLEARLARPVFYELAELGGEELIGGERQFGVWSGGLFFRLGDPGEE